MVNFFLYLAQIITLPLLLVVIAMHTISELILMAAGMIYSLSLTEDQADAIKILNRK